MTTIRKTVLPAVSKYFFYKLKVSPFHPWQGLGFCVGQVTHTSAVWYTSRVTRPRLRLGASHFSPADEIRNPFELSEPRVGLRIMKTSHPGKGSNPRRTLLAVSALTTTQPRFPKIMVFFPWRKLLNKWRRPESNKLDGNIHYRAKPTSLRAHAYVHLHMV